MKEEIDNKEEALQDNKVEQKKKEHRSFFSCKKKLKLRTIVLILVIIGVSLMIYANYIIKERIIWCIKIITIGSPTHPPQYPLPETIRLEPPSEQDNNLHHNE